MVTFNSKYLKATDCKDGDKIRFVDAGKWVENTKYKYPDGNPRQDFVITVEHNGEEKSFRINKTNRDVLIPAYGNDSEQWINKAARIKLVDALVSGKQMKVILLEVNGKPKQAEPVEQPWDE